MIFFENMILKILLLKVGFFYQKYAVFLVTVVKAECNLHSKP